MSTRSSDERHEEAISALVDLELERDELLPVIDRLVASDELRRYYREARELDALVLSASQGDRRLSELAPSWDKIRDRAEPVTAPAVDRGARRAGWFAMAAMLAVAAIAAWMARDGGARPIETAETRSINIEAPTDAIEVVLGADAEAMNDQRFVEMTAELLAADRRYHRKMQEILELIGRQSGGFEGSQERSRTVSDPEASSALEAMFSRRGETRQQL